MSDNAKARTSPTNRIGIIKQLRGHTPNISQKIAKITQKIPLQAVKSEANNWARKILFKLLKNLQQGRLTIVETYNDDYAQTFGTAVNHSQLTSDMVGKHPLEITLYVHHAGVYRKLLTGGSIALADSYINQDWDTDDLTGLIRLAVRNETVLKEINSKSGKLTHLYEQGKHKLRHNSVVNAKSNILAHYDIGNEMYQTFLDETMMYSSALYKTPEMSLADAQQLKLQTLCEMLDLQPTDNLIEIGTGWGGLAIYAAEHYGCHVTTTTISDAQYDEAKKRVEQAGLSDKITLLKQDYRELTGKYDKLISVEMVEAVGHAYLSSFFKTCNDLLKPNGIMVMQAITFVDQGYSSYLNSVDFIQSHIFPGGCLLSNQEMINQLTESTDMVVKSLQDYGYDYAYTLRDWRNGFEKNQDAIKEMGYDDSFIRLWQFYFAYCEGGFLEKTIGLIQVRAEKPYYR